MKNLLTLFLITFSCSMAFAMNNEPSIQVKLYLSSSDSEPVYGEDPGNYHRMPTHAILCSISVDDGVSFDDGTDPDIISYEIKDADNNQVAVTNDEADFILTLFSITGEYVIQFRTEECVYYGSICI